MKQSLISATELSNENGQLTAESSAATEQLQAISRISALLSSTLLLDDVLEEVLREALDHTDASAAQIALQDDESGNFYPYLAEGQSVPVPDVDARVLSEQQALLAHHLQSDAPQHARSALVAPILFEGAAAGLIRLFSPDPTAFEPHALIFVSALCSQAAVALGNARRFTELKERNTLLQRRTQQIEHFLESSRIFHSDRRLEEVYEEMVYAIQEGVGFNIVVLSLIEQDENEQWLRRVTAAGLPLERARQLQEARQPWAAVERILQPEFRLGGAYFVPSEQAGAEPRMLSLQQVSDLFPDSAGADSERQDNDARWRADDLFFILLRDSQGKPLGLINLAAPLDGRRPGVNTARVLEVFANQAASAIENVRLFHSMWDYALQLQQLHNVSQQTLREPDFDHKLELILNGLQVAGWQRVTLTLRDAEFRATRLVSAGLSHQEEDHLQTALLPSATWRQRFNDNTFHQYRRGNCYLVPGDDPWQRPSQEAMPAHPPLRYDETGPWPRAAVLYRPLYDREQQPMGLLALWDPEDNRLPDENALQTIDLYAQFAISVIESYRLFSEMQRRSQELQTLFEASRTLAGTLDQAHILQAMGQHMLDAVGADAYAVLALGPDKQKATVLYSDSSAPETAIVEEHGQLDLAQLPLATNVVQREEPLARQLTDEQKNGDTQARCVAALPLILRDELFGLVQVAGPGSADYWEDNNLQLLGAIVNQASTALETAHLVEELDERVAQRTQALAEEVAKAQSILESIADGVLVAEADGTVIVANVPSAHILGLPRQLLVGKTVYELGGQFGQQAHRWSQTISQWTRQAQRLEPHTVFKDRMEIEERTVSVHVSPVFANKRYFGTISIFRDITREVEVDRMKSEFVSTVSHELRTPMTSIKGYADLLLMGAAGSLSKPQLRFLDVIKKNADRLKALVDDLLDISRIETGKTQLNLQPVDIPQLVRDVVNNHLLGRIQHEKKEIDVSIDVAPSLPLVNADPEKVTRILTNLVDNAFNYTPTGGEITVGAVHEGDFVWLSVRDTGIGISKENQSKIFERFYRVEDEDVQERPGTGLGLSIVRSLVEMHSGELTLESELGAGSTFSFSLPCVGEETALT
ncbi:MAG TPA: ATP-binding protein [Candidatus Sulfomarinibacteraceae bacterium]|nr:ATP-binding protein [Candidatus Sulfomarinibacteraceae bacterium]